jgi:CubicO group peptidase (beta-lactamase class C family)
MMHTQARRSISIHSFALVACLTGLATNASAQNLFDFSAVTTLAEDALAGRNVNSPVRGFEIMLVKEGRTVYQRAFGRWNVNEVGAADSATKTLAGAVIMSLTDSSPNPFSLDTRLSQYIPAFSGQKSTITIRQAFSHTSGLAPSNVVSSTSLTLQQAALVIAAGPLDFIPGSTFSYGGTSMHAAGAVAELAGGAAWNDLFAQRIAGPLGLTRTRFVLSSPSNPRIAGGCESNAAEFCRFMEMLRRGGEIDGVRVLSQAAVNQMFTRQPALGIPIANTPLDGSSDYGIGVWLDHRHPDGSLEGVQAAGARGFSAWIDFDDGMVGAFATDLTQSQNIRDLIDQIRAAAQDAIRNPLPCTADFNADGFLDFFDYDAFVECFEGGPCPPGKSADFNADGFADFFDYDAFVASFEQGC